MNINNIPMGGGTLARRRRFLSMKEDCPYQRIEYLENSQEGGGKAYIDTSYIPNEDDFDITVEFLLTGKDVNYKYIFSALNTSYQHAKAYRLYHTSKRLYINIGNRWDVDNYFDVEYETKILLHINGRDYTIEYDNEIKKRSTLPEIVEGLEPNHTVISLFNMPINNEMAYCRIYSFKWNKGSETVLDLIPVRVDDEGFMYDRVSGKLFGNAGTGRFILGPDINS